MENRNYVSDLFHHVGEVIHELLQEYQTLFDGDVCKDRPRADELFAQFNALQRISGSVSTEYLKLSASGGK
jgi:hypothetical protein